MKVLKGKTTILAIIIVAALIIVMMLGIAGVRSLGGHDGDQQLLVLCETGQKNLDTYFENVEQSVEMVSAYVESDLEAKEEVKEGDSDQLSEHLDHVRDIFAKMANETEGAFTYYYRIDPEVSTKDKGFWYVNLDGEGFEEHEPTDITQYDTSDTSKLVWFTVPKATGKGIWLPPYITDNLDKRVISYNAPIYQGDKFIGVIGIEIDYRVMAEQVDNITLYEHGYAFISDAEGVIIYHPHIDVKELAENMPKVPAGLLSKSRFVTYSFEGVKKRAVWLPLSNGMRLNVTAPLSEINAGWHKWAFLIIAVSLMLLILVLFLFRYLQRVIHQNRETEDENARLEKELQSASELTELMGSVSSLMLNMPAMTFSKDAATGVYLACNQNFAVYARKSEPKEVVGLTDYDLFDPVSADHFIETDKTALSMDEAYIYYEDVWDQATATVRYLQTTKKTYRDSSGKLCVLGMCVDVTETTEAKAEEAAVQVREQEEKKKQELEANYKKDVKHLSYKASHDELTGLYNRLGYEQVIQEIDLPTTHLLMIDADKFKAVNDTYGHDVGDRVLIKIAKTLQNCFRSDDRICRMGGDEFVVFMVHSQEEHRERIVSGIDKINRDLMDTEDGLPAISVSVGIAHGSEADSPTNLIEMADRAMYDAKRNGACKYCFYEAH